MDRASSPPWPLYVAYNAPTPTRSGPTANATAPLQTEATGEAEHEQLEEIEVIFGCFECIDAGALRNCRNLQKLTSEGHGIFSLESRLTPCTRIESKNNKIQTLKASSGGVSNLVNLQKLNLANNRIRDVDEFEHLRKLVVLRQLTFTDEHFGSNPIVNHPDYRSFAVTILKHLRLLDGTRVGSSERASAEDKFFTQSMEFNDQLAELTLAFQQELRSISTRKERGISNAQMLQRELIEALNDVESCVTAGQAQIEEEKRRQLQLREQNAQLLRENVGKLQKDFCSLIHDQYEQEERALIEEERDYEMMELEAMAEQNQALTIATLQNAFPGKIAFQQLLQHMPDYRYIAESFRRPTNQQEVLYDLGGRDDREVHILQIYRYFHDDLSAAFEASAARMDFKGGGAQGSELYLYLVADDDEVISLLQNGLVSPTSATINDEENNLSEDWVFLFSNPLIALQFYKGTVGELEPLSDTETDDDAQLAAASPEHDRADGNSLVESFNMLLCQVRMPQVIELFHPEKANLSSLDALRSLASPAGSVLPPPPTAFLQLNLNERDLLSAPLSGGHVYMARRDAVHTQVLPQFVLLCSKRSEFSSSGRKCTENQAMSGESILTQFQQQVRAEIDAYHTRLYHEMDPATVRVRAQFQHESEQLRSRLKDNEDRIKQEKQEQEQTCAISAALSLSPPIYPPYVRHTIALSVRADLQQRIGASPAPLFLSWMIRPVDMMGNGGSDALPRAPSGGALSERSPLLRAMGQGESASLEAGGSYMSMPAPGSGEAGGRLSDSGQFQPLVFAEKALGALLDGVLLYALGCVVGVALVSLNFEGVLGARVNWWLVFLPFWLANAAMLYAHAASVRHAKTLRRWADVDAMSNEPLLPLLRRIVLVYAISFPLSVLLLWSELAFCASLQNAAATSLYICYAPLMVIQVAFVVRYLLCRSDSTLPGVCWVLLFAFTLLLAYQTDTQRRFGSPELAQPPLSWWIVFAPLFAFELLMTGALLLVLYNEFSGVYRLTRWQLAASVLYSLALVAGVSGELMLLEQVDYHWGTFTFPSGMMFFGLVCACVAMYIVGRHHVEELMASKGGAVPVPLTRTADGWITSHAVVEQWVLFGDIYLTPQGLHLRNQKTRSNSGVESETAGSMILRQVKGLLTRVTSDDNMSENDPERRIRNVLRRKTSGSYSDIMLEVVDTPKTPNKP
ncbi:unnamed protein product [Phytophthora fragariaefolia]|uniref:Unnamed protein product n=1 Tax=Phytophthora fragariaefolia TaxID=1490495 RepID=A0A9W6Y4Q2_9STRA|nr:unnamed protein product [Phytophthora fragariaefolia]